jgi:hypothetical protein
MDYFVAFLIVMVVHAVILAVALAVGMYLQSFQFGVLHVFAAKAVGLLVAVTLLLLFVPFGFWISLLVWFVGFWLLFEIDPREAIILTGIVLAMNFIVRFLFLAVLLQTS